MDSKTWKFNLIHPWGRIDPLLLMVFYFVLALAPIKLFLLKKEEVQVEKKQ